MAEIKDLTLKEAREKLAARQQEMGKVFEEAKTDDGQYDFRKVTCLGNEVKGSIAVAEKVKALNEEANALAAHAETLESAERAAGEHANREKARGGFRHPGASGSGGREPAGQGKALQSLGERVASEKSYRDYAEKGAHGQIAYSFDDMWPTDMLAAGMRFETLGSKALMTRAAGFAPESVRLPGFVEMAARPIQLLDIIPTFRTEQAAVKYMEETTRTHAAAERAEGVLYPESTFVFTERTSPVEKIADSVPVTDEQLEDVPMMEGYINNRLTFGVRQRLDAQVLVGDGTAPNLRGLKNLVGIQTQARGADPVPDAFYKAMTRIRLGGRAIPTHHVIHPNDWETIRLLRSADGIYIWGDPRHAVEARLWGLPVVLEDADVEGRGYTGSFLPAHLGLFERRGVDVQVGYVSTQFAQGLRTVRADLRAAMAWFKPAAFCEVTGL